MLNVGGGRPVSFKTKREEAEGREDLGRQGDVLNVGGERIEGKIHRFVLNETRGGLGEP